MRVLWDRFWPYHPSAWLGGICVWIWGPKKRQKFTNNRYPSVRYNYVIPIIWWRSVRVFDSWCGGHEIATRGGLMIFSVFVFSWTKSYVIRPTTLNWSWKLTSRSMFIYHAVRLWKITSMSLVVSEIFDIKIEIFRIFLTSTCDLDPQNFHYYSSRGPYSALLIGFKVISQELPTTFNIEMVIFMIFLTLAYDLEVKKNPSKLV